MKRLFLICAGLVVVGVALAPTVNATQVHTHLKVTVCHNVDHNPHPVTVSVNAVGKLDGGHGFLNLQTLVFTPHTGTGGHEHDFLLAINGVAIEGAHSCGGDDEETTTTTEAPTTTTTEPALIRVCLNGEVLNVVEVTAGMVVLGEDDACPVTTTTTLPQVTTTTLPQVTVTTLPPVTTTTIPEVPHNTCMVNGFEVKTDAACPAVTTPSTSGPTVSTPPVTQPSANVAGPAVSPAVTGELPHTGANTNLLAGLGGLLVAFGLLTRRLSSPKA